MANVLNSFEEVQKMCKKKYDSWSFDIMHYYSNAIFQMAWCKFAERKYNEAMKFAEECIEKSKEVVILAGSVRFDEIFSRPKCK